jgi:hypothetical protein
MSRSLLVLALLAACAAACGGALAGGTLSLHDTGHVLPMLGINDAYHGPLPPEIAARDCGHVVRTPQRSGAALDAFLASIASCWSPTFHDAHSLKVLALVEGPDVALAAAFAARPVDAIELGNELELPPHNLTVAQYAQFLGAARAAVRAVNASVVIITGGVFTLNDATKPYLLAARAACPDCTLGVHLYEDLSDADLAWLAALQRPIAVTEFGFPTRCDPARLPQQRDWIAAQWARFALVPAITLAVVYQRPVGPACSDLDTFGIAGTPAEGLFP